VEQQRTIAGFVWGRDKVACCPRRAHHHRGYSEGLTRPRAAWLRLLVTGPLIDLGLLLPFTLLLAIPFAPLFWLLMVAVGPTPMTWEGLFVNWLILSGIIFVWMGSTNVRGYWALYRHGQLNNFLSSVPLPRPPQLGSGPATHGGSISNFKPPIPGQELPDHWPLVIARRDPRPRRRSSQVLQQLAKELDDPVGGVRSQSGSVPKLQSQPLSGRRNTHTADHRHLVAMPAIRIDHRRFVRSSPTTAAPGIEKTPCFIDQNEVRVQRRRFFLNPRPVPRPPSGR